MKTGLTYFKHNRTHRRSLAFEKGNGRTALERSLDLLAVTLLDRRNG
jgi:hypothetical protein